MPQKDETQSTGRVDIHRDMKRDGSKLSLTSIDATTLPILSSPEYAEYNPQLNHIFIDSQYFSEPWHADYFMNVPDESDCKEPWRLKEKMRTSGVALVVCLNIGVDPPDVVKPANCARRECWFDPTTAPKQKGLEFIGNTLQQQYEKWHSKAKFKQCLDPTSHDLERICINLRRQVKNDRLLLHYNGHGVPRPTRNGELWVFGKHHTHYMPISVYELRTWLGEPSIFVLDCSGAGALLPHFADSMQLSVDGFVFNPADDDANGASAATTSAVAGTTASGGIGGGTSNSSAGRDGGSLSKSNTPPNKTYGEDVTRGAHFKAHSPKPAMRSDTSSTADLSGGYKSNCIVLAACGPDEILPMNPQYPADLFTSCLTTPIPIALRWFVLQSPHLSAEMNLDMAESIPGKDSDRKTPRGGLNWIFTAIADTIAWSCLPSAVFQNMFRQDLLLASLFRNFLLAQRIMRTFDCTPRSYPELPDCSTHPLWQAWDTAVEHCLLHVHGLSNGSSNLPMEISSGVNSALYSQRGVAPSASSAFNSPFFSEQLMAFEVWLDFGGPGGSYKDTKEPPVSLPILFQALLSHAHRLKALHLLRRYVALGPEAVHSILAVGVFPYILKLLHNPMVEIRHMLMSIWTYVIGFDNSCRDELVKDIKDKSESRFIQCLRSPESPYQQRTMAAFIQAEICNGYLVGQQVCLSLHFHRVYASLLSTPDVMHHAHLKKWIALSLSKLCEDFNPAKRQCIIDNVHLCLYPLLLDAHPAVRMASVLALGEIFGASLTLCPQALPMGRRLTEEQNDVREKELEIAMQLLECRGDGCAAVRREAIIAVSKMIFLPVHFEVVKVVASKFMSLAGESELGTEEDVSSSSAYGSPKSSPRPGKSTSGPIKPSAMSSVKKHKKGPQSVSSDDLRDITDAQSANIIQSVQLSIESRLEPFRGGSYRGTSVFSAEPTLRSSLSPPGSEITPPPEGPPEGSIAYHLAKSYVHVWWCLLDTQKTDPHSLVVMAAKALIFRVKVEITKDALTAEPSNASKDEMSSAGRSSEGAWLSGMEYGEFSKESNRGVSHDGPRRNTGSSFRPPKQMTSPSFVNVQGGNRRPISGGFALDAVNGHFNDKMVSEMALVSTIYDWNRKFFLRADLGYEPVDDLLSPEGKERSNRLLMRGEVNDLANRIAESFRVIQDQGLTSLLEKDTTDYSLDMDMVSMTSLNRASSHDIREKTGIPASMLPSSLTRFESRGIMRVDNAELTSSAMFHAFHDILAVSDSKGVGVWSLESGTQIMHIDSSPFVDDSSSKTSRSALSKCQNNSLITSMTWVNESLDTLVMAGCQDGSVKIWRDVGDSIEEGLQQVSEGGSGDILTTESSGVVLASAFKALPDITGGSVGSGMVMSWQQCGGLLSAGGNSATIRLWDVSQEKCVTTFQTGMDTCLTALVSQTASMRGSWDQHASWGSGIADSNALRSFTGDDSGPVYAWSFAGFADGSIGIYDQRVDTRGGRVHAAKEHNSWIVSAHLRADIPEVITGAVSGGIKFWDIRSMKSYKTIEVHKSPLTALSVHNCAPIMATGSQAQFIKILTLAGDQLGMIRYHDGFMGNRIGPVCCLAFHPVRMLMAAGSTDNLLSIYSIPDG